MAAPRARGRPPATSRDAIVAAVLDVGFGAASIGAVAARMGLSRSTLYGHFRTRDEMVAAAAESVLVVRSWPATEQPWRPYLEQVAGELYDVCVEYEGLGAALTTLTESPPTQTRLVTSMAVALLEAGAADLAALAIADSVFHLSVDLAGAAADAPAAAKEQVEAALDDIDPRLRSATLAAIRLPPRDWFAQRLTILLYGAEHLLR